MLSTVSEHARPRFDDFEVDLRTHELRRSGRLVRLPEQSFLILAALIRTPGELVTRDELRQLLWPKETFIDQDQALHAAVSRLRDALRDVADSPKYIETLPRRGYRFIAAVDANDPAPAATAATVEESWAVEAEPTPAPIEPPAPPANNRNLRIGLGISIAAAALLIAFEILRPPSDPASEPRLAPLTSLPGREISPSYSPTGDAIAFAWNGGDAIDGRRGFDLYIRGAAGEKLLRQTHRPASWMSIAWSHHGRHIAFARADGPDSGIFLVPALGGEERRLVTVPVAESALTQLSWSPDDREILYSAFGPTGTQTLYKLPLDSLAPQPLQAGLSCWDLGGATFSPDGSTVGFICTSSVAIYSIHIMRSDGTQVRKLADVQGYPGGIAWAADGASILFANDAGEGGGLWRVTLDGEVSRLPLGEDASAPAGAANGNRIAYVRTRESLSIWRVDLQSASQPATRLIASTRLQTAPQYSPDGSKIAFQSNRSGSWEIWIARADGTEPVRISTFNGPVTGAPSWCADGKRLAFDSRASGASALYIADIVERLPRKVATSVENLALPAWSNDCQWLIASDGNQTSYLVPAAGGEAKRFTLQASYYASPAADRIVFNVKGERGVTLWHKRADAQGEQPLAGFPMLSYTDSWVAGSSGIYFTLARDDARVVRFYDFTTHAITPVAKLSEAPAPAGGLGLSVSRDGRFLLYVQAEQREADIMQLTW